MVVEFHGPRAVLDIPKHTRHVAGRRDDLPVVDEAAAAQVPRVCAQLSGDLDLSALRAWPCASEGVDGADVIEPAAGHEVAGGCIGAGHDPRRAEWDGVDLVCGVGVPHDELAVLGCGDDMAPVCCPVEGVDLCEVALEGSADLECDAGEGGGVACHGADWLSAGGGGGGLTACVRSLVTRCPDLVLESICLPPRSRNLLLDICRHGGGRVTGKRNNTQETGCYADCTQKGGGPRVNSISLTKHNLGAYPRLIYLYKHSPHFTSQLGKPDQSMQSAFHSLHCCNAAPLENVPQPFRLSDPHTYSSLHPVHPSPPATPATCAYGPQTR